jgi:hypothetical protein
MKKSGLILIALIVVLSNSVSAQDFSFQYRLNLNDANSFTNSCGIIEKDTWIVSRNSCNIYTPVLQAGELSEYGKRNIEVKIRVTNNGQMDDKDFVWIFYYIDEKPSGSKTLKGSEYEKEILFREVINVPARSKYRIRVAMVCDDDNEEWRIGNGDIIISQYAVHGEEIFQDPQATGKVYAKKDRNIIHLNWNANYTSDEDYFRIERSGDGNRFEFAGFVKMKRASDNLARLSFIDSAPYQPETWYKVTIQNADGEFEEFGKPVSVRF